MSQTKRDKEREHKREEGSGRERKKGRGKERRGGQRKEERTGGRWGRLFLKACGKAMVLPGIQSQP